MTGMFVLSISGRDKGRVHVIVANDAEKGIVYICDGKTRKLEKPKPKKLKHIKVLSQSDDLLMTAINEGNLSDSVIRAAISRWEKTESRRDCSAKG